MYSVRNWEGLEEVSQDHTVLVELPMALPILSEWRNGF